MPTIAYRVVFEPDDNNSWFVRCPTAPGAQGHGRTLTEARANIREAIAEMLDVDPSTFDLVEEVHSPRTLKQSRQRREMER
jgi:predicted RNase H-like HicB family nuclease